MSAGSVATFLKSSSHHRHQTRMCERRHINHLAAAAVSQTCSAASAGDTHQLWLKGCDQGAKRPNASKTGKRAGRKGHGGVCARVCVHTVRDKG